MITKIVVDNFTECAYGIRIMNENSSIPPVYSVHCTHPSHGKAGYEDNCLETAVGCHPLCVCCLGEEHVARNLAEIKQIIDDGQRAFRLKKSITDCPNFDSSIHRKAWKAGFYSAMDRVSVEAALITVIVSP